MSAGDLSAAPDPLTALAIKHGTDKWGPHFYTPHYHRLLGHLRDRPVRLLEIGVGGYGWRTAGGESLAMWAEYFPHGHVVSFDVVEKHLDLGPRVTIRQGSQADPAFLTGLCDELGPFDIVIDDGSHRPDDVVTSFETLFPLLGDPGVYIIEDVQASYWPMFAGSVPDGGAVGELVSTILSRLNHAEIEVADPQSPTRPIARRTCALHAYHNLIVVEKGDNTEPSNFHCRASDPHIQRALATMEEELARAPTAGGLANLAMLLYTTGEREHAEAVLTEGLDRWPQSTSLLTAAIDVVSDVSQRLALLERLARLEGEASRELIDRVREAITRGESTMTAVTGLHL